MKDFNLICAVALNGVIGDSETNSIPWYLPLDLKHFKSVTEFHTVVMGSRTFLSIGKPLKNRKNVVITRSQTPDPVAFAGIDAFYPNFADVIKNERDDFFVIGGSHIYAEAVQYLPKRMFLTIVHIEAEGDVRFPIEGRRLIHNVLHLSSGGTYHCKKRSASFVEGGIKYEFTEWERHDG